MVEERQSERDIRIEKVSLLKSFGIEPYAQAFNKKTMIGGIVSHYGKTLHGTNPFRDSESIVSGPDGDAKHMVTTAGRLTLLRTHGKLSFARLMDESGDIQLMFHASRCLIVQLRNGEEIGRLESLLSNTGETISAYKFIEKFVDIGDWIGVEGELFYTHKGELTIFVSSLSFLAKSIRPLGDKFHGIGNDREQSYRQRYLDMIFDSDTMNRMKLRSTFIKTLRDFYHEHGFIELDTPILGFSASGAAAHPFVTHHEDFDIDMYLRIAPEISLKIATVGGLEKVFEIGKDFRNEGSSPSHHQEFLVAEHYAVYWNYEDNMKFTEQMFDYLFAHIPELKHVVKIPDKEGVIRDVDFHTPWQRIDYVAQVKKDSGIDVSLYGEEDEQRLRLDIKKAGLDWYGLDEQATATMIDYLYKKVTRPKIIGPAFVYNYPKTMQPLARVSDTNPHLVEQFQLVVNGREITKAYGELVNPLQQQANFDVQSAALEKGDTEATAGDDNFVKAMEYGMPPQSGWGMGIDRILALLTEQTNIRDVIMFPMMKPEHLEHSLISSKKTELAVALVNTSLASEGWKQMNTIAHLSAAFAARCGKALFMQDDIVTKDGQHIKLNIQHAIVVKELPSNADAMTIKQQAEDLGLVVSCFTQEMLDTTDDKKVVALTADRLSTDIDYLGVLIFGTKKEVEEITRQYPLYSTQFVASGSQLSGIDSSSKLILSLDNAELIAKKYLSDTLLHCQQVAHIMRYFALKLGLPKEEQDYWYIVGLLHDVDRDVIGKDPAQHLGEKFVSIVSEISADTNLIDDIRSHYTVWNIAVDSLVRKYLISVDELSGLLFAYSRMRPEGFGGMQWSSINKEIKDKAFAAGVDRDHVRNCETYLGIPLQDFAMDVVEAMKDFTQL